MANEEGMLRLAGSCRKATVTLLRTYQVGKPCTVSSVGKDVEPRDLLLLLVETGAYCRERFGTMVRHVARATLCEGSYWETCCVGRETTRRRPIETFCTLCK